MPSGGLCTLGSPPGIWRTSVKSDVSVAKRKWRFECPEDVSCPPFREVEIVNAINSTAPNKAQGPGGLPAQVSTELPSLTETAASLFSSIVRTRSFPVALLDLSIIPLGKPDRDPAVRASKRPISQICPVQDS